MDKLTDPPDNREIIEVFNTFLCVASRAMSVPSCDIADIKRYIKLFLTETHNVDNKQNNNNNTTKTVSKKKVSDKKKKNYTGQKI